MSLDTYVYGSLRNALIETGAFITDVRALGVREEET
jgi:hypothetical protein